MEVFIMDPYCASLYIPLHNLQNITSLNLSQGFQYKAMIQTYDLDSMITISCQVFEKILLCSGIEQKCTITYGTYFLPHFCYILSLYHCSQCLVPNWLQTILRNHGLSLLMHPYFLLHLKHTVLHDDPQYICSHAIPQYIIF